MVQETEDYANSDVKINGNSPHHVFHIYPPAVLCNLLPVSVTVMDEVFYCNHTYNDILKPTIIIAFLQKFNSLKMYHIT